MTNFTNLQPLFLVSIILLSSFPNITTSVDTLVPEQSLKDGQTLVSNGQRFELGFFSPGSSKNRYLGIWYKDIPSTVLWVANRNTPIEDSNGFLKMDQNGNLVLLSQAKRIILASKLENTTAEKALTKLLDSGNLIVRNEGGNDDDTKSYIWQSFNHATDTLLPGMKLGWDSQVGFNNSLISWKSYDDPSSGDYSYVIKSCGCAETYLLNRETPFSRSGPWNGFVFNGVPGMKYATTFITKFVINEHQRLYSFDVNNASVISRLVMDKSGTLQRLVALPGKQGWITYWKEPNIDKVEYNTCGANGVANDDSPLCDCLKGFKPRSETEWAVRKTSGGCIRTRKLESGKDDGFLKYKRMKLPDCSKAYYNQSLKLKECKEMCKKNHSCTAYANSNITKGGSGCIFWTGDLVDLKKFNNDGQDLYVRVAASELDRNHKSIAMIIIITMISVALLSGLTIYFIWRKRVQKRNALRLEVHRIKSRELQQLEMFLSEEHKNEDLELPLIDINVIALATENFSDVNKLGEGGFGPVYKGSLTNGLHIAVKRLSKNSNQGVDEFKNEARLIAKLQHRNLVRILGCCIGGEEKMLIYEYVPNKSLDYFLFDKTKILYLDWGKRFNIILGIARGLLYLHQDCRLRIIHRDLKASNILLDDEMNPKISDFGMARIFGSGQSEANTLKVVGTYGYMSPEYAMDGQFSVKSDVFSYGVLILEIISGKKNKGFYSSNHETNLLGYAWRLWGEGKGLELMDESMYGTWSTQEVLKCIQVGLLCVQEHAEDRPTISSVILMLGVETAPLIQPKQPGFTLGNIPKNSYSFSNGQESCSVNDISFTTLEAR